VLAFFQILSKSDELIIMACMLLTREQLQERLFALHSASLELVKDVSLETLLERIAATACEQAGARYAALGVLDITANLSNLFLSACQTRK